MDALRDQTLSEQEFLQENKTLLGTLPAERFIYTCHISRKYHYLYLATQKVACTTALLALQKAELENADTPANLTDIHVRERSPLLKPTQVGHLSSLLESPEYFKFCFVRNPFTRLLSCYIDKIDDPHHRHLGIIPQKWLILRQLGRPPDDMSQCVSFEEFVDAVAAQWPEEMDYHWSVQWHHLCEGRMPFDVIGKFENFSADFEKILDRIGINSNKYFDQEKHNVTEAGLHLKDYYDRRLEELVRRIYAADFEHLGYPRDLPGRSGDFGCQKRRPDARPASESGAGA